MYAFGNDREKCEGEREDCLEGKKGVWQEGKEREEEK